MHNMSIFDGGILTGSYIANKWIRLLAYSLDPKAGERGLSAHLRGYCRLSANPLFRFWRRFAGKFNQTFTGRPSVTVLWLGGMGDFKPVPPLTFGQLGPENLEEACASFPQLQNNRRIGDRKYDNRQKYGQRRLGGDAR
jgi:hypothetical protein